MRQELREKLLALEREDQMKRKGIQPKRLWVNYQRTELHDKG